MLRWAPGKIWRCSREIRQNTAPQRGRCSDAFGRSGGSRERAPLRGPRGRAPTNQTNLYPPTQSTPQQNPAYFIPKSEPYQPNPKHPRPNPNPSQNPTANPYRAEPWKSGGCRRRTLRPSPISASLARSTNTPQIQTPGMFCSVLSSVRASLMLPRWASSR